MILSLRDLTKLTDISFVENMTNLRELDLFGCTSLVDLKILDDLKNER